jgi:outer membrane phospholipase A
MTRKALLIFATVIVTVLFSFTTFAQEQGQEATKSSEKIVTYADLQAQRKTIEDLRTSYDKINAEYNAECKEKTFKTMNEYPKECKDMYTQLTTTYSKLKKEIESYNKNTAQFKAYSVQKTSDTAGSSSQGKGK